MTDALASINEPESAFWNVARLAEAGRRNEASYRTYRRARLQAANQPEAAIATDINNGLSTHYPGQKLLDCTWRSQQRLSAELELGRPLLGNRFVVRRRDRMHGDFWNHYLNRAYNQEAPSLRSLAQGPVRGAARTLGVDSPSAIFAFVKSIHYRLIPKDENLAGLRTPLRMLYQNASACDSHAMLAAALIGVEGHEAAVSTVNIRQGGSSRTSAHAVLGIAMPSPLSGAVVLRAEDNTWLTVEVTGPSAIGDMRMRGYQEGDDLALHGWKAHILREVGGG